LNLKDFIASAEIGLGLPGTVGKAARLAWYVKCNAATAGHSAIAAKKRVTLGKKT
jgi:hypothetical protein